MHTTGGTIVPGKTQFYDPKAEAGYEGLAGYLGEWTRGVLNRFLIIANDEVLHEAQMYFMKFTY